MNDNSIGLRRTILVGLKAGLLGAVCIWLYEAIVLAGIEHQMTATTFFSNGAGLVFGKQIQLSLGLWAGVLGTTIHFSFAMAWGVVFALVWPWFARRQIEATLVALGFALFAWIVMHTAIAVVSNNHPDYRDPNVIINGVMSHFFYTVPLALYVKRSLAA